MGAGAEDRAEERAAEERAAAEELAAEELAAEELAASSCISSSNALVSMEPCYFLIFFIYLKKKNVSGSCIRSSNAFFFCGALLFFNYFRNQHKCVCLLLFFFAFVLPFFLYGALLF